MLHKAEQCIEHRCVGAAAAVGTAVKGKAAFVSTQASLCFCRVQQAVLAVALFARLGPAPASRGAALSYEIGGL